MAVFNKGGFNIISSGNDKKKTQQDLGTLSLNQLSSVIIDADDQAVIDLGAIHAKSKAERGIKFLPNREEVPNGLPHWVVWVTFDTGAQGAYYAGVTACYMTIDREARRGYKILAEHVNLMDYALKRRVMIDALSERQKQNLKQLLNANNEEMWHNASSEFKQAFEAGA